MPPFSKEFNKQDIDYYKIQFLDDWAPGKEVNGNIIAHPLYAVYVIDDHFKQYQSTKDQRYKKAIIKVADASIKRMSSFHSTMANYADLL